MPARVTTAECNCPPKMQSSQIGHNSRLFQIPLRPYLQIQLSGPVFLPGFHIGLSWGNQCFYVEVVVSRSRLRERSPLFWRRRLPPAPRPCRVAQRRSARRSSQTRSQPALRPKSIAGDHSYKGHAAEYPGMDRQQYRGVAEDVINNGIYKSGINGRIIFWYEGNMVVYNSLKPGKSTMYRPVRGIADFEKAD